MIKKKILDFRYFSILFMLIMLLASVFSTPFMTFADEVVYTTALEDLQKDESFSLSNYPLVENDYTLQVIQIAENIDNELFVYVYQPSANKNRLATCINMSINIEGLDCLLYNLEYINSEDTLFKYKVKDFIVKDEDIRVYDITSIYRKFDESIDEGLSDDNNNTIDEVSFPVAKVWTAQNYENQVIYTCLDTEVITITDKYVGFVRYPDGFSLFQESCDSHFVAFSTDKPIDKLLKAKVYFSRQLVTGSGMYVTGSTTTPPYVAWNYKYDEIKYDDYAEPEYLDKQSYTADGWFGYSNTYTWDRIQTPTEFFDNIEFKNVYKMGLFNQITESSIDSATKAQIENKQWVLRFEETPYYYGNMQPYTMEKTIVGEVSVIELTFETDGQVFNLGVVDNKQSGSENPSNKPNQYIAPSWLFWLVILIVALIAIIAMFPAETLLIVKGIFKAIGCIFKGIWWVITLPLEIFKKDGE